ncbi:sensor histidine kinase [Streptomyces abikoensis]
MGIADSSAGRADRSGFALLEAVVGNGFTTALQEGLGRSAVSSLGSHGSRGTHGTRQPGAGPVVVPMVPAQRRPAAGSALGVDTAAVMRRYEAALPGVLQDLGCDAPTLRSSLALHARCVLAAAEAAAERGGRAPADAWRAPAAMRADTRIPEAAAGLLLECALQEVLASGDPRGAGTARRAARVVRLLGGGAAAGRDDGVWRERRRLAREIHDQLGTSLTLALRHLESPGAGEAGRAGDLVREALGRSRELVGELRLAAELPPLARAVEEFAAQVSPGTPVSVAATGDESLLSDASRRELFWSVRECLCNSFVHAPGTAVAVTTRVTRRWAHARVEDAGPGFEATRVMCAPAAGGLRWVRERIEDIGGRVAVESTPGEGTRVSIHVPLLARG